MAKVAAHAVAGGAMSLLRGGKFGHGFASAGLTQAFSGSINRIGGKAGDAGYSNASNRALRVAAAATVGGTASSISGGKFANGAVTGAFSRAFNDEMHFKSSVEAEAEYLRKAFGEAWDTTTEGLGAAANWLKDRFDLSADAEVCAGPCIGGEVEYSASHGVSTTIQSGFGAKVSAGAGTDMSLFSFGNSPKNGTLSTYNYMSGQLGPVGLTIDHSAWQGGSHMNVELNLRIPGGGGVNGGTGLKKW